MLRVKRAASSLLLRMVVAVVLAGCDIQHMLRIFTRASGTSVRVSVKGRVLASVMLYTGVDAA